MAPRPPALIFVRGETLPGTFHEGTLALRESPSATEGEGPRVSDFARSIVRRADQLDQPTSSSEPVAPPREQATEHDFLDDDDDEQADIARALGLDLHL